jgi:hypothetical protein
MKDRDDDDAVLLRWGVLIKGLRSRTSIMQNNEEFRLKSKFSATSSGSAMLHKCVKVRRKYLRIKSTMDDNQMFDDMPAYR